jgi:hypothetical protein
MNSRRLNRSSCIWSPASRSRVAGYRIREARLSQLSAQGAVLPEGAFPQGAAQHLRGGLRRELAKTEAFERSRRDRNALRCCLLISSAFCGLGSLRLRGLRGAQFEFTLAAIAQNLRRLAKLVARPPPLVAPCVA